MISKDYKAYCCIAAVVAVSFGLSIKGDFVFDDYKALVTNPDLKIEDGLFSWKIWHHDFWGNNLTDSSSHKSYRPLTILTYRFINKICLLSFVSTQNDLEPRCFHFINLLSYFVLCCFLFDTLKEFLNSSIFRINKKESEKLSFWVSILFASHPVHCESVFTCVGLADILSAFCSIYSLKIYVKNIDAKITCFSGSAQSIILSLLTSCLTVMATFFKEHGLSILGFYIFINLYLMLRKMNRKNPPYMFQLIISIMIYLLATGITLYLRLMIMNFSLPIFGKMDNPASSIENVWFRMINFSYIYAINSGLVLFPAFLSVDWSMGCIPLIESLSDIRILVVLFFWLLFLFFLYRTCFTQSKLSHLFVCLVYSIVTFLPSSNLFFQVGFVVAERNLFLPILGYLLILAFSYHHCLAQIFASRKFFLKFGFSLVLLSFISRSFLRTQDWMDELHLYEKDLQTCPLNAKLYYNIAKISSDTGDKIKAKDFYRTSLELYANYSSALVNYANILKEEGKLAEAKELLEKACTVDSKSATSWMNLAVVEMALGNYRHAEYLFTVSLRIRPNHGGTFYNLGNLYLEQKRYHEAENAYQKAINLDPTLTRAWNNLILLNMNHNQTNVAHDLAKRALRVFPKDGHFHFLLGNLLGQQQKVESAENHFKKAIAFDPTKALYYHNLAVLYHRMHNFKLAKQYYQQTLRIDPNYTSAIANLKRLNI